MPEDAQTRRTVTIASGEKVVSAPGRATVGFIGSGNYAMGVLIPAFKTAGARLVAVASSAGVTGLQAARKFGFEKTTTDPAVILDDPAIDAVVIATRHDSHASLACKVIDAGKHLFMEKPLALTRDELSRIETASMEARARGASPLLTIGFNRRFAPHVVKVKSLLAGASGPKSFVMTVNAGAIPEEHWTQDREAGGGRILGEACHFIDLLRFLAAAPIASFEARAMATHTNDTVTILLSFDDGSMGAIHYFANGSRSFPKERLEIFTEGRILQLNNFRKLKGFGWKGFSQMSLWRQDKGQKACAAAFVRALENGGPSPIPHDEIFEVARVSIDIAEALRQ